MKLATSLTLASLLLASPAAATDVADAMLRAGLSPDALAAAGVTSGSVTDVVAGVADHLDANPTDLSGADADFAAAKAEVDALRRLVRSGTASAQDTSDLATAKSELASAESARDAALDAIFDAGTDGLAGGATSTLSTIRGHAAWSGLPIEFLAKDRSDSAWVELRDALANEALAAEEGTSVLPACATVLSTERSDADVSAAATNHATHAASVASAWATAVSGS